MSTPFPFGAKTTAPPAFGTGSITFGTPATQTQPNLQLTTSQPSTGFQLGASAPAVTTSSSLFGAQMSFKPTGFGTPTPAVGLFNAPTTTPSASTGSIAFGAVPQPNTTTSAPIALTFGLGITTTSTAAAPTLSFGPVSTTSTGLSFGTSTTTLGSGGLSFGATGTTTSGLGTTTATTSTGLSFGLGGTATSQPISLTSTAPIVVGLGGTAVAQTKMTTTQKEVPPKEQVLPNEILQTVEQFKQIVKQQKLYSSDIARCSVRDFRKVEQEIDHLVNLLNAVEYQLQKNRHLAEKLKYDTAKCLQDIEMAQRTQDIPPGLQYENTAPLKYFLELADQFEREMQVIKVQIESADKYVKNHRSSDILTPQDLSLGMRRLHETFVALAGRLQSVHGQVETQKENYLNIRKQICNDVSNPFEKLNKSLNIIVQNTPTIYSPPKVASGPTPFSNLVLGNGNPLLLQQNQTTSQYPEQTNVPQSGFGFGSQLGIQPANTSLFGSSTFGQTSFNTPSNFQLQKPPTGVKRGKQ